MSKKPITYEVVEIPIDRIRAFAFQPRKWFDPAETKARADSMRVLGQQDPVTVERLKGDPKHDYELINGESRLRSARLAGLKTLWAAVRSEPFGSRIDKHMAALVANFNRSEHTPMEISDALYAQHTEGKKTQHEIAVAIGKNENWVSQYISLQNLHTDIKPFLHPTNSKSQILHPGVAFELARIPRDKQLEIYKAARGADGRVTKLRVQMEIDRTLTRKQRRMTPSRRREKIVNTVRAIRLDLAKLQAAVGNDVKEALRLLQDQRSESAGLLEEGIDALQSVKAVLRREQQHGTAAPKMCDLSEMTEAQREEYVEQWRIYWLIMPTPPIVGKRDPLLIEYAYPKLRSHKSRQKERDDL